MDQGNDKLPGLSNHQDTSIDNDTLLQNDHQKTNDLIDAMKEKSLEFEDDLFSIDSIGRKEYPTEGIFKGQKVRVHPDGNVAEYIEDWIRDDILACKKGKQIFLNYDCFIQHVADHKKCSIQEAEDKYMLDEKEYIKKMRDVDRSGTYNQFYEEEIKDHLTGYRYPDYEKFDDVGRWLNIWLVGGSHAILGKYGWDCINHNRYFGFSGRLLKN